jgi:hypothetical protein
MLTQNEVTLLYLHCSSSTCLRDDGSTEFTHLVERGLIKYAEMSDQDGARLYAVTFEGLEALIGYQEDTIE